jgi:conjugal transfer/type IV secretion protein DotA/TraY
MQQRYYEWVQFEIQAAEALGDGASIALRFTPTIEKDPASALPTQQYLKEGIRDAAITYITASITEARNAQIAASDWAERAEELGWAGAGMWYNKVAQYNGTLFSAVYNLPQPQLYPEVMEYTRLQRMSIEEQVQPRDRYRPYRADDDAESPGGAIEYRTQGDFYIAQALYFAQQLWADNYIPSTQNPILDYVNLVFGTTGLFNMRQNIDMGVHPMAALVGIGSSLVESSVMSVGAFALGGVLGGVGNLAGNAVIQKVGEAIRGISFQLAVLGLSLGFILFYVLPFLPFIYFFFAFSGWIKAVFEAMVGLPLWALAHLRIDGEGINGPHTMDGFFLVFEIFIRPVVIIIALVSSVAIFSAMINVLNNIWDLVLTNLVGNKPPLTGAPAATPTTTTGILEAARGTIDYLFYTVIYAIFVYLIGLSSFKLIDLIPNYTLRWMGKSIKTIGEGELGDDPGQSILQNMYGGSQVMMSQFQQNSALSSLLGRH